MRVFQREEHKEKSGGRAEDLGGKGKLEREPQLTPQGARAPRESWPSPPEPNPSSLCSRMTLQNSCCLFVPQFHPPCDGMTAVLPF